MMDLREQVDAAYKRGGADAAIAAVLGVMRSPSEGMEGAGISISHYPEDVRPTWQAMLTTFASEHEVEIGE